MDKYITMSQPEVKKYDIIKKTISKELNGTEATKLLKLSIRQIRRLKAKVKAKGIKGLIHANRGRKSNRKIPEKEDKKIIILKIYFITSPSPRIRSGEAGNPSSTSPRIKRSFCTG